MRSLELYKNAVGWSNFQHIEGIDTGDDEHSQLGDVNHDGYVSIGDVSALIDYLLGNGNEICTTCADVNGDTNISIGDVTDLIDKLLSSSN